MAIRLLALLHLGFVHEAEAEAEQQRSAGRRSSRRSSISHPPGGLVVPADQPISCPQQQLKFAICSFKPIGKSCSVLGREQGTPKRVERAATARKKEEEESTGTANWLAFAQTF